MRVPAGLDPRSAARRGGTSDAVRKENVGVSPTLLPKGFSNLTDTPAKQKLNSTAVVSAEIFKAVGERTRRSKTKGLQAWRIDPESVPGCFKNKSNRSDSVKASYFNLERTKGIKLDCRRCSLQLRC